MAASSPKSPTSPLETKHLSTNYNKLGLALVDVLNNETNTSDKKSFIFASSPRSPIEFGAKSTRDHMQQRNRHNVPSSPLPSSFSREVLSEMELSEDYTCVISHGPNPKTIHIFDNCVVESCCSGESRVLSADHGFLSFCHGCKKSLSQGNDIFMYRGEKGFCSEECRCREMLFDNGMDEFS